jgi:Carbohydrate esterase, sialic acid-specific acetylesterase
MSKKFVIAVLTLLVAMVIGHASALATEGKPLKIFILAGQSNMEGHVKESTFNYMESDPVTAAILKDMRNADGSSKTCEKVWISYLFGGPGGAEGSEKHGKLMVGYGAQNAPNQIGPEFTFGLYLEKILGEPILLIKTAWGGKSLNTDFRPPSAGPYEFNQTQLELMKKQGKDIDKMKAEKVTASGHFYHLMTDHVKKVVADIKQTYPDYDAKQGYELAGFVWFQGWNDLVDSSTYPERTKPGGYEVYHTLLAQFIRDVRKDLSAPKLPFVIGVIGVGGPEEKPKQMTYLRQAMSAPASLPEFKGTVANVLTEKFWDAKLEELVNRRSSKSKDGKPPVFTPEELKTLAGASNAGYHYLGAAKIMAPIGKAMAEAMGELIKSAK